MEDKVLQWNGGLQQEAVEALIGKGRMIVSPTKVGYIVMTSDGEGLGRKFEAKQRKRDKPGVVLCGSLEQLHALAETNDEIDAFYQRHWNDDVLLGCILPWKAEGLAKVPNDGSRELMMDRRGTSCFVVRFGLPSEHIAAALWEQYGRLTFASSANPSGTGNRGVLAGIGERIHESADLIISADEYVRSIQPNEDASSRYEQGVMISMVDAEGRLIPEQGQQRSITPAPVVIRKGLDLSRIMANLGRSFNSWDYRHGEYY
ncbi:L-threonylcarbamoyladenylate synthase [Streptomyces vinaceus]|uniref:L-threonylcarbamoyladenylate synthase n=1 Tax=Streptomyces vinaceus TaxID=1960 RepID=UPI0035DA48BD